MTNQISAAGDYVLRTARDADIPAIIKLINANLDKLLPRAASEMKELLDTTWVIEENGKVVGSCCLEIYSHKIAELRTLAVDAACRGKGYGIALVKAATAEARRRKIPQVLTVSSAKEFFEKLNFGPCLNEKYALFWNG